MQTKNLKAAAKQDAEKEAEAVKTTKVEIKQEPETVTIPVDEARALLELYVNVEAADAHFQSCQSTHFRNHLQGVYKAKNISAAYDNLKHLLND